MKEGFTQPLIQAPAPITQNNTLSDVVYRSHCSQELFFFATEVFGTTLHFETMDRVRTAAEELGGSRKNVYTYAWNSFILKDSLYEHLK